MLSYYYYYYNFFVVVVVDAGYCVTSNKNSRSLVVIDCTSLFVVFVPLALI